MKHNHYVQIAVAPVVAWHMSRMHTTIRSFDKPDLGTQRDGTCWKEHHCIHWCHRRQSLSSNMMASRSQDHIQWVSWKIRFFVVSHYNGRWEPCVRFWWQLLKRCWSKTSCRILARCGGQGKVNRVLNVNSARHVIRKHFSCSVLEQTRMKNSDQKTIETLFSSFVASGTQRTIVSSATVEKSVKSQRLKNPNRCFSYCDQEWELV